MKTKLTDKIIRDAEPQKKIYEIRDALVPGLCVRISPNTGAKFFDLRHNEYGRQVRFPIGPAGRMTIAEARAIASARRIAIQLGWIPKNDPQD